MEYYFPLISSNSIISAKLTCPYPLILSFSPYPSPPIPSLSSYPFYPLTLPFSPAVQVVPMIRFIQYYHTDFRQGAKVYENLLWGLGKVPFID